VTILAIQTATINPDFCMNPRISESHKNFHATHAYLLSFPEPAAHSSQSAASHAERDRFQEKSSFPEHSEKVALQQTLRLATRSVCHQLRRVQLFVNTSQSFDTGVF
jgi:hypothetical protein